MSTFQSACIYFAVALFFLCLCISHWILWDAFAKEDVLKRDFISLTTLPSSDVVIERKESEISSVRIGNDSYSNVVCKNEIPTTLTLNSIVSRKKMWGMTSWNQEKFEVVLE